MITALIFGYLIGFTSTGIREYPSCLKENFKNPACENGKILYTIGKKGCEFNGKTYDGSVCK